MNSISDRKNPESNEFSEIISLTYKAISGPCGPRNWDAIRHYFHPDVRFIRKNARFPGSNYFMHPHTVNQCIVSPDRNIIQCGKAETKLEPKIMDLLIFFMGKPNQLISRRELLEKVWKQTDCYDESLTRAVFILRKAFKYTSSPGGLIETVSKRGYRFVGTFSSDADSTGFNPHESDMRIMSRDEYFSDASTWLMKMAFYVSEVDHQCHHLGDAAQVISQTTSELVEGEVVTKWNGVNFYHFVRGADGWKIINVLWDTYHKT